MVVKFIMTWITGKLGKTNSVKTVLKNPSKEKWKLSVTSLLWFFLNNSSNDRSSPPEVFSGEDFLKICSKFIEEHPYQRAISIKLLCNFIEIAIRHGCSPVNLLHIFRIPFSKNTSGKLLLKWRVQMQNSLNKCLTQYSY